MKWFRSLLAGSLAFTAACASGPQTKPSAMPEPAASAKAATPPTEMAPAPAPAPKVEEGPTELFASALKAYEAGDLDGARKGFEKVVLRAPQMLNAQFNLGVIAERQGRKDDARVAYEKVLLLEPGHVPSVANLGRLYRQDGRPEDAITLYEKALKVQGHEHDAGLLNGLATAYRLAEKLDESEATSRRVLARSKDNPEAYKNLAQVAYARGKYRLAELLVSNARKVSDKDPGVYNLLGMIYLKLDDRPLALSQFQKAVSLDEKFVPGYLNLGALALSYRDYAGAERAFTKAVELEPDSVDVQMSLAWALDGQKTRDPKKGLAAGEAFEKVLASRAESSEAVCGAGWAYAVDKGGWEKAIGFLDRCKGLQTTTEPERQMITAKVNGLQTMLKNGQPQPAAAEAPAAKKDEATGGAGNGSMLNQLPQDENAPAAPEGEATTAPDTAAEGGEAPAGAVAPSEEAATGASPSEGTPAGAAPTGAPAATGAASVPAAPTTGAPASAPAPAPTP